MLDLAEERRRLVAERDALLAALAEAHGSLEDLNHRMTAADRQCAATRQSLGKTFTALVDARAELEKVRHSRLWRLATAYWRLRQILRSGAAGFRDARVRPAVLPVGGAPGTDNAPVALPPPATRAKYDIVCFPIIEWDFRFQRPQQLLSLFAAAGHRVFYLSQRFRSRGAPFEITPRSENVFEVTLLGPGMNVYRSNPGAAAVDLLFSALDGLRRDAGIGAAVALVQLPFWWPLLRRARSAFAWPVVYDCMDLHTGFSTNGDAMMENEDDLLRSADLVAVSSGVLETRARALNRNVLMVRNGCDYDHFASASGGRGPRPTVGYYGAISDWFDTELLAAVAQRCSDLDFILVGSTYGADVNDLRRLANVRLVGERPYDEIPGWVGAFDVCVIPFRRTPLTEATNPVKAYEILAAGKPLVSVELPELREFESLVRFANDPGSFEREIRAALAEDDPSQATRRREFASRHTWAARQEALSLAIAGTFARVSVIVVTWNNRELNRACLDSLRDAAGWPNLQVIVVDNASSDGSVEDLRERERQGEIVAIFNAENRGFAAANNQGLLRADGDVLVLLNNDTVMTRGCLAALVRRLRTERSVGMAGPSTNAIGNEARVDVGYRTIAEMPAWAAAYVREHDGSAFPIPMLAMFCVAFRRDVWDKVGPLDERFGIGMFEDDDYAQRVRNAGFEIVCARDAFVHHWMKASFAKIPDGEYKALFDRNRRLFEEKWGTVWTPHADAPAPRDGEESPARP